MEKMLNTISTIFDPDKVEEIAKAMAAEDPDWEYRVIHDPAGTGGSLIRIFDENGEFVGTV